MQRYFDSTQARRASGSGSAWEEAQRGVDELRRKAREHGLTLPPQPPDDEVEATDADSLRLLLSRMEAEDSREAQDAAKYLLLPDEVLARLMEDLK
jgi:hypothetical protein